MKQNSTSWSEAPMKSHNKGFGDKKATKWDRKLNQSAIVSNII